MTKDEALKLALEAGFRVGPSREGPDDVWGVGANLERFAKLVEEKEREACAKLFDEAIPLMPFAQNDQGGCLMCGFTPKLAAQTIRARGQGIQNIEAKLRELNT